MDELEERKALLTETLASAETPPPILHPSMSVIYRERVAALHGALQKDDTRAQAAEVIRSLVSEIVLTPEGSALQIDVRGDLAGILKIASAGKLKSPPLMGAGSGVASQVMLVAGRGFEPLTFRL
jgi:site-specific DNA recombinase